MTMQTFPFSCDRCGTSHGIEFDPDQLTKGQRSGCEPVFDNFICPDMALMYRVLGYALDTRVTVFKSTPQNEQTKQLKATFRQAWGEADFDAKFQRYLDLNLVLFGVPDEYYKLLSPVVSAYCCAYFYPAMTSAGALGERILNRLVIKTRDYFKHSPRYKKVYNKTSFADWDLPIELLAEWKIISDEVAKAFSGLKKYRNDSIHYNEGYDFEANSHDALRLLGEIVNRQFNYTSRTDLLWVFNVPGEIWVRTSALDDPFAKEFVIPHSLPFTAYCEPTASPAQKGRNAPTKPLTDEEFISLRIAWRNQRR